MSRSDGYLDWKIQRVQITTTAHGPSRVGSADFVWFAGADPPRTEVLRLIGETRKKYVRKVLHSEHSWALWFIVYNARAKNTTKGSSMEVNQTDFQAGKLASLNRSWQSKEGTYRALGMAGIEPTPSKSECNWTLLSPLTTRCKGSRSRVSVFMDLPIPTRLSAIWNMACSGFRPSTLTFQSRRVHCKVEVPGSLDPLGRG